MSSADDENYDDDAEAQTTAGRMDGTGRWGDSKKWAK